MGSCNQFIVARSSIKHEKKKKLSNWAFLACFVMIMSFFALLNSSMGPLSIVNFQITSLNLKEFFIIDTQNDPRDTNFSAMNNTASGICNFSLPRSDYCEINGDVRIHGNSSSIYISPSILSNVKGSNILSKWKLRPYARKVDRSVMKKGKELSLGSPYSFGLDEMPNCSINHKIPAIIFSAGGYAGNIFHEFSDILVPLYITSKSFNGEVQFLITSLNPNWVIKHKPFLESLTNYSIIDMDKSNEVHCFESAIVGLKNHIDFGIDPSMTPQGYSMTSFTQFVRNAYKLKRSKVEKVLIKKPRLMIISRKGRRAMLNEDEVATEARGLGYDVAVMEASRKVEEFSRVVNSFDIMMGVHGAGLTNSVFLPEKAVLIQIVPLGLEWGSTNYYELPAKSMNLRYLDYKVCRKESSLADEFFVDDPVMWNSSSLKHLAWPEFKKFYLDGQNVRIDVKRFRSILLEAMEMLQRKMYGKLSMRKNNFNKHEHKKLFTWAYFGCFVMALGFCALLNSYMNRKIKKNFKPTPAALCNYSFPRSDFCEINGNVSIHGNSSSIYIPPSLLANTNTTWKLRTYARKIDRSIMQRVRELTLGSPSSFNLKEMPHCSINHKIPAIVFSVGGYTGNFFHTLTDVLVPLYITSRPFNGEVQFLVTNIRLGWLKKYKTLLDSLSNYPIVDVDSSNEVHCFPSMIVGLKNHKEFSIDPLRTPQGYSMTSFTQFVRSAYSLKRNKVHKGVKKPRLLIISRRRSRAFLNVDEVTAMARRLRYEVVVVEGGRNMEEFSRTVNSFDVVVGVHGAGLTNVIFLPENAVLIQVVPIGLEWLSKHDFELPAIDMNLRYLEYKISVKESSLAGEYMVDDPVIKKPTTKPPIGWAGFKKAYLDGQNVRIDVGRFRATLVKALELLQQ
ncbi:hypothetical protein V2J09_014852 [Rumex salicifolius]